ncbi:MAG: fluoride efflux transporter CrcB [Planctomycetota bacterium]|nr:fluoride efflux transporter CrcB [Planctomycetota bacterium]
MWTKLIVVAFGGTAGSTLRYLIASWAQRLGAESFPAGTLTVNVVGCLVIGFLATAMNGPLFVREEIRLAVLVGVLGGFTTFSSFAYDSLDLAHNGQFILAGLNVLLNNTVGLLAAWGGARLANLAFGQ